MEFNAGIFSFTGTRKNPLNIFRPRLLTMWAPLAPWAAGVAFVIYQYYQWLDAVNLSARRSFLESWPQWRFSQRAYKKPVGLKAGPRASGEGRRGSGKLQSNALAVGIFGFGAWAVMEKEWVGGD